MNNFQKLFVGLSILATCVSLWFVPWRTLIFYFTPLPETVQEQVDQFIDAGIDGAIVHINTRDGVSASYVGGVSNRANQTPIDPNDLFKIASVTKLYVAATIVKLVARSELDLDRKLSQYLPEMAGRIANADQITLAMLVQHRSGIPNYSDHVDYDWFAPRSEPDDILRMIFDKPAAFSPDSRFGYSNTNYFLIGMILKRTLGQSYEYFVQRNVLEPLGLTNSYTSMSGADFGRLMSGYDTSSDEDLKALNFTGPMGSMIATAEDVGRFLRYLVDGTLFDAREQEIYSSLYAYGHTGLLPGYSSIANYHEDLDAAVVQFANTSGERLWWLMEVNYDRILKLLRADQE